MDDLKFFPSSAILLMCCCISFLTADGAADFCSIEREKCKDQPHIGCNNSEIFKINPSCSQIKVLPMTNRMRNTILGVHNDLRNKLAGGMVQGYPTASKMLQMSWDSELEETACEHVKYCNFEHDKCRATVSYQHPGQNIRRAEYVTYPQVNQTLELVNGIMDWFDEYKDVTPDIIDKYQQRRGSKQYGHFTVMSRDINDRVGCCYITYEEERDNFFWYNHLFTCNYRETNVVMRPVYKKGETAVDCHEWGTGYEQGLEYPSLCRNVLLKDDVLVDEPYTEQPSIENFPSRSDYYCHIGKMKCGRMRHVGCDNDPGLSNPNCKELQIVPMTDDIKEFVVGRHNEFRNLAAIGGVNNLPVAGKMLEMEWDTELEDVACAHVQRCEYQPSECHSTMSYDHPGENLHSSYFSTTNTHYQAVVDDAMQAWFNTSQDATPNVIDAFSFEGLGLYAQYTQMVREGSNKIGCCYAVYTETTDIWYKHLINCNYKETNVFDRPVYTKSNEPAVNCSEWGIEYEQSHVYGNLCSNKQGDEDAYSESTTTQIVSTTLMDDEVAMTTQPTDTTTTTTTEETVKLPDAPITDNEITPGELSWNLEDFDLSITDVPLIVDTTVANLALKASSNEVVVDVRYAEAQTRYCFLQNERCNGSKHIGCAPNLKVNPKCNNIQFVTMSQEIQQQITHVHNEARNQIARGRVLPDYPSASKMLEMSWDPELADVACQQAKYCHINHNNECHATESYPDPGQMVFTYRNTVEPSNFTHILQTAMNGLFNEHKKRDTILDHFPLMVKDGNDKIGCCCIKYITGAGNSVSQLWHHHLFTCNYRENNFSATRPTYTSGEPASRCSDWSARHEPSSKWKNLCALAR